MNPGDFCCGECQGKQFPEGMFIFLCPACKAYIHPGCWEAHAAGHSKELEREPEEVLSPRRGRIRAYGIVQWDN
ncbi:MAG: hypothetical protein GY801_35610 [bacterium]|nr:hypothetical protein [bacterium]